MHPSPEAIEEFKILRNSYGPEFGNAGGAQINVVTRGGTNTFRGSGFYFVRNDAFNSTDYFLEKNESAQGASCNGTILARSSAVQSSRTNCFSLAASSGTSRIAAPRASRAGPDAGGTQRRFQRRPRLQHGARDSH